MTACHVVATEIWFDALLGVSHHVAQFYACSNETEQSQSMLVVSCEGSPVTIEDIQIAQREHECSGPFLHAESNTFLVIIN